MTLSGLYPERVRSGARPHWVAVWSGQTNRGRVAYHERLPCAVFDTSKEDATEWARNHQPEWSN